MDALMLDGEQNKPNSLLNQREESKKAYQQQ